jgi:hypothetical protein
MTMVCFPRQGTGEFREIDDRLFDQPRGQANINGRHFIFFTHTFICLVYVFGYTDAKS